VKIPWGKAPENPDIGLSARRTKRPMPGTLGARLPLGHERHDEKGQGEANSASRLLVQLLALFADAVSLTSLNNVVAGATQ
jgi:hypothetical protein